MRREESAQAASRTPTAAASGTPSPRPNRRQQRGASIPGGGGGGGNNSNSSNDNSNNNNSNNSNNNIDNSERLRGMVPEPSSVGAGVGGSSNSNSNINSSNSNNSNSNHNSNSSSGSPQELSGDVGNVKGKGKARANGQATRGGAGGSGSSATSSGSNSQGGDVGAREGRSHGGSGLEGGAGGAGEGVGQEGEEGGAREGEDEKAALEALRSLTKTCLEDNMPESAVFYADKLVTFSGFDREDVLLLAKAQFACGSFLRTVHLLAQHRLLDYADNFGLRACHLAARSLRAAEKMEESISLLEKVLGDTDAHAQEVKERAKASRAGTPETNPRSSTAGANGGVFGGGAGAGRGAVWPTPGVDVLAALCFLRGQAYGNMDNRPRAAVWLKTALEIDARCVEALHCLTRWHLLSIDDQAEMVSKLDYGEAKEDSWLHFLFKSQLNRPPGSKAQVFGDLDRVGLGGNLDVLAAKAECCYDQNDAQQALDICRQVFRTDPHNDTCLPVYLAAMVELKMKSQLFYTAHQLVEAGPKRAVSWFGVGCYYHLLGRNELAQRYFLKSTKLDGRFAPAWIGFGNAFAAQEETDQAVSAYRTAARLFQGSHMPLLYIGMEYVRTHNLALARNFLMGALALSPSDPLVLNELGVVHFSTGEYEEAKERFVKVLSIVQGLSSQAFEVWESTVFNLGHCYRKLGNLEDAVSCYVRARELSPGRHSVHSALAFTFHLQGQHDDAIAGYHRALGLKPDDSFSAEMLKKALQESFAGNEPCAGLTDLLSKTSLSSEQADDSHDSQHGRDEASTHNTPSLGRAGGGGSGDAGSGIPGSGRRSSYGGRMRGVGEDRSFSFGEATPGTPNSMDTSSSRYGERRRGGRGRGGDFSTPVSEADRRRGAGGGGGGMEDDSFDNLVGSSSFGGGASGGMRRG